MNTRLYTLILYIALSFPLQGQNDRAALIIRVIETAKDFEDISPVLDIIKKDKTISSYIPHLNPLGNQSFRISSTYGYRKYPITGKKSKHHGLDFVSDYASKIYATASGTVVHSGQLGGYGKCVIIKHRYGFKSYYAHLTHIYVPTGTKIETGQVVGFLGSTGKSTGNHLHYEIRKGERSIDPLPFLPR